MTSNRSSPQIECPIGLFEGVEEEIERLTAGINRATAPREKSRLAHEIIESVTTLLDCRSYDANNANCRLCRDLSMLRQKTATVIEKATALGR